MNDKDKNQIEFNDLYELANEIFANYKDEIFLDNIIEPKFDNILIQSIENNTDSNSNKEEDIKYARQEVFRNKNIISKSEFDDGLDSEDIDGIKEILSNKKFLLIVLILCFIFVCIVVVKAFYFGDKVEEYKKIDIEIEEKYDGIAKVYEGKEIDTEVLKKVAATELINCINSKIDMNKLPDSIKSIINEINEYYGQSNNYFAFAYKDIYTGFTVSYNADQNIWVASTIKAPVDIYIYEMASQGKINLDEELTYTGKYYNDGTGVLKKKPIGGKYSVRTLVEYSIVSSDNAAHNMLMDKYGRNNMLNFWKEKGTSAIFTGNDNWGLLNANDALIYMNELYSFYVKNNKYGEPLMQNFINAKTKFITGKNDYTVANKSGWGGTSIHDVSIIFADNPYIVIGLSNLGRTDYYMSYFNKVNDLAYRLHVEYWKYKMNTCKSIKQYD